MIDPKAIVTLELFEAYEALGNRLDRIISETAQDVYEIRHGKRLYGARGVYLTTWERDGEMISASFAWSYGGDHADTISFPVSYLESNDWKEPLRLQVSAEKEAKRNANVKSKEEKERAEFLRLQAKYGEN